MTMYRKLAVRRRNTTAIKADLIPAFHLEKLISEFFRFDECVQQVHKRQDADNKNGDHHNFKFFQRR